MDRRSFQTIKVGEQAFLFDFMIYGGDPGTKQPLVIFHSIEFAMPPSEAFCQIMWDAGLQVISSDVQATDARHRYRPR